MKKIFVVLLAALALAPVFAGGGGQASGGGKKGSLSDGKTTLTWLMPLTMGTTTDYSYNKNKFTKKIVDETGINLDMISIPGSDFKTRFTTMMNSGDYPDLIGNFWDTITMGDIEYYAQEGILPALDNQNLQSYPNIKKMFDENPTLDSWLRSSDGKIHVLPNVNICYHCVYNQGNVSLHRPWLNQYNRKIPETMGELTDWLRFIRDNDINGNGKNDEVPAAFSVNGLRNVLTYIAKSYMPFVAGNYYGLAMDNSKKIVEQYKAAEFRQALRTLNQWYKEKLIIPESFTMSFEEFVALGESQPTVLGFALQGGDYIHGSQRYHEMYWLMPMKTPDGKRYAGNSPAYSQFDAGLLITDKCKNPKLAVALYDWLLDPITVITGIYGPKGQSWAEPDPGALGQNGKPALYKLLVNWGSQEPDCSWGQLAPYYFSEAARYGEQATDVPTIRKYLDTGDPSLLKTMMANPSFNGERLFVWTTDAFSFATPESVFLPSFTVGEADSRRLSDIAVALDTYEDQIWIQFITGEKNIDNNADWNAYLSELDRLGSKEKVAILQKYIR